MTASVMPENRSKNVAIVTGAATGIGLSIAKALGLAGHPIAIVDIEEDNASAAAKQVAESTGAASCSVVADVSDETASAAAHQHIVDALGPASVLVNNAGIMVPRKGRLEEVPATDIEDMLAIHVGGTLNWSRLVIPGMRSAGFGRIINVSSCNAVTAVPYRIGYVTAKKAIRGVTEALALETARAGITVNAIAPGYILTDVLMKRAEAGILDHDAIAARTPVGRWGKPEEIANAVAFLASDNAAFITGTTLVMDGGLTIRGDAGDDLDASPHVGT